MKKTLFTVMIILLVATTSTLSVFATDSGTNEKDNIQAIQGIVTASSSSLAYIDTEDGNGWYLEVSDTQQHDSLFEIETLYKGDRVVVVYDDRGTADIYDDELITIVKIK